MKSKKSVEKVRGFGPVLLIFLAIFTTTAFAGWTTHGPTGTGISATAVDPNDSSVVYVAYANTVYKSIDKGESFTPHSEGILENESIHALAVHPIFSNVVFAGGRHLYRSLDGAETWQEIGNGLPPQNNNAMPGIMDILIDHTNPNIMYVATYVIANGHYGGVYKSIDTGENFVDVSPVGVLVFRATSLAMDSENHNIVYVGLWGCAITGGVWRTTNGGEDWIENADMNPEHTIYSVEADPYVPGRLFAGGLWSGCWLSEDYGESWDLVVPAYLSGYSDIDMQGTTVFYACEGAGLFRSTDSGVSWIRLENGIPTWGIYEVSMSGISEGLVFVGGAIRHNLYKSLNNGNSFTRSSKGFPHINVYCVAASSVPTTIVYSGAFYDMGVFKSEDNGNVWFQTMAPTLRVRELAVCPDNPAIVLAVFDDIFSGNPNARFFVYRSTDGGEHFTLVLGGLPGVSEIVFDPTNTGIAYLAISFVMPPHFYMSTNSGSSWTLIPDQGIGMRYIKSLVMEETNILYAGTHNTGVYKSIDGGYNWFPVNTGIEGREVTSLSRCFLTGGIVAGTDNGVYRTTNSGEQWQPVGTLPFEINDVFSSIIETRFSHEQYVYIRPILWAATDYGVYEYINNNWETRNDGLDTLLVRELTLTKPMSFPHSPNSMSYKPCYTRRFSVLHAATPLGTYEYTFIEPGSTSPSGTQGNETASAYGDNIGLQIYPNPFHTTTEIRFQIFQSTHIFLNIYDITGQLVQKLADDYRPAGPYSMVWDGKDSRGRNVPEGIYFVRMKTGDFESTSKMLLIR